MKLKEKYSIKELTGFSVENISLIHEAIRSLKEHEFFDYPCYGGLPKTISRRLTGEQVDYIQDYFDLYKEVPKNKLVEMLIRGNMDC